jgi:hypothetical protein
MTSGRRNLGADRSTRRAIADVGFVPFGVTGTVAGGLIATSLTAAVEQRKLYPGATMSGTGLALVTLERGAARETTRVINAAYHILIRQFPSSHPDHPANIGTKPSLTIKPLMQTTLNAHNETAAEPMCRAHFGMSEPWLPVPAIPVVCEVWAVPSRFS